MELKDLKKIFKGLSVYTLDIETSYNLVSCWRPGSKISVPYTAIQKERGIICYTARDFITGEIFYSTWDIVTQDDSIVIKDISKILSRADILITYNGKKFDVPWINGRALALGLPPLATTYTHLDLYPLLKKSVGLNSHKLDYISSLIGVGKKISTSIKLWDDIIIRKKIDALEAMLDYNIQDVKLTADLFVASYDYLRLPSQIRNYIDLVKNNFCCGCCGEELIQRLQRPVESGRRSLYRCPIKSCGLSYSTIVPKGAS